MSKMFMGLTTAGAGFVLLMMELSGYFCMPFIQHCTGALLGAGGVLFLWSIMDHVEAPARTPSM